MIWNFRENINPEEARDLSKLLGKPVKYAEFLLGRGLRTQKDIQFFTSAKLKSLPFPETMPGMRDAVEEFLKAREEKRIIAISGDYDVDGLTATAVLTKILKSLGYEVISHIPNRLADGYGLNPKAVEELFALGAGLLVTVDCGVSDMEAILTANKLGLPVIVTDHHNLPPTLPPAKAIINPHLGGGWENSPLAGVGVAFMLAWALRRAFIKRGYCESLPDPLLETLALVALGTIADMAPLIGTNRTLVRHGLKFLSKSEWPSLKALKIASKLDDDYPVSARDVGFRLAPKINAAGRMGSASPALELLVTEDLQRARVLADKLEELNRNRYEGQMRLLGEAQKVLEDETDPYERTVVLAGEGWPRGLLGLVASRISETVRKPSVLFSLEDDMAIGSGRTTSGFNLYEALERTRDLCESLGGHSEAAGLRVKRENLPLFKKAFEKSASLQPLPQPEEKVTVDIEIRFHDLQILFQHFQELEPFGQGNPAPVALVRNVRVTDVLPTRTNGDKHLIFRLFDGTQGLSLVGFNLAKKLDEVEPLLDFLFVFDNNRFNQRLPGWRLLDFKSPGTAMPSE
jgi:single-stranded-DNA-specific exonuclease